MKTTLSYVVELCAVSSTQYSCTVPTELNYVQDDARKIGSGLLFVHLHFIPGLNQHIHTTKK